MPSQCAYGTPRRDGSCLPTDELKRLAAAWTARHPDDPISGDRSGIAEELARRYASSCEDERCWLRSLGETAHGLEGLYLAPKAPVAWRRNPNEWLTSTDISKFMKQVERRCPEFRFVGPSPIDFDARPDGERCVWPTLCNLSLRRAIVRGKSRIGVILNLDKHYDPGSHWVAMWISPADGFIVYFDSARKPTPREVGVLARRLQEEGKELGYDLKYVENGRRHQKENTECGMYCLYFLESLASGKKEVASFLDDTIIPDEEMERLRGRYFEL